MVKSKTDQHPASRKSQLTQLAILLLVVFGMNVMSNMIYRRIDLTKEKRYTLSQPSKELAEQLDEVVYFQVFLEGDFPSDYRRLKNATKDMLNEFRLASGGNIEFLFEDVLSDRTVEEKDDVLRQLAGKGLPITQAELEADDAITEKFIIPGALVNYKDKEYPLNLLKRDFGKALEDEINGSIELLEYEIANVLRKCVVNKEIKIAFTEGHQELDVMDIADAVRELEEYYTVHRVNLNLRDTAASKPYWAAIARDTQNSGAILYNGILNDLQGYSALIVAKPRLRFLDEELLILDQYVMRGGKIIWLVDALIAEMDSLDQLGNFSTADYDLNINSMLFRYGVRVNPDLIQDLNCHGIPVMARRGGSKPGWQPWVFYPILTPDSEHPIVRNMTSVWSQFVSSIDTLPNAGVKKTVLLHSSENSRVLGNPVRISMDALSSPNNPELFNQANKPAAVLLEGTFESPFAKRRAIRNNSPVRLIEKVANNAMIVISDGDLIRNQVNKEKGEIYPLGYDRYASRTFGQSVQFANKKFMMNCIDYLCDDSDLIEVRSKKVVLRLLDKVKVKTEKSKWQIINMGVPLVLLLIFGFANAVYRKKRYAY
jgi:ABC-2 type transport system permease protein